MADDIFKSELLLEKSIYNTNAERKDLEALAQTIQNLMIIEQGTYPNQPELGVGIENYQFEFIDDQLKQELKEKVDNQISKFIPTNIGIQFDLDTVDNDRGSKILVFTFIVSRDIQTTNDPDQITIIFGRQSNKKVISKIIL
ncbi:base plate wedge subunit [Bacillus phage AR9]|uniref:Base plate wedge subunit n=2 Tax=Bacillus phage PBS1 TaxID=10683 RepID=A0A172JIE6_BPPB1|nr:base plate wedge subunit [Bacillus phage AR9]YP_009664325.1 tail lysozyme [Bacillus phage PBS1]PTU25750.1 hypothetical protein DA469_22130 [Bacillus subtilis]QXN70154.1 putative baseplate protein [Bacillus phage vB_BspM_Internexus]WCS68360.1 hypothetical protein Goe21_02500 [Bacillus phage vB_BsuM-Goe21]AMS01316.1 base plate wedge subunit [Bacillus phage AR9]AST99945.1 tail lysozyme [Bacillus phage PBS1]